MHKANFPISGFLFAFLWYFTTWCIAIVIVNVNGVGGVVTSANDTYCHDNLTVCYHGVCTSTPPNDGVHDNGSGYLPLRQPVRCVCDLGWAGEHCRAQCLPYCTNGTLCGDVSNATHKLYHGDDCSSDPRLTDRFRLPLKVLVFLAVCGILFVGIAAVSFLLWTRQIKELNTARRIRITPTSIYIVNKYRSVSKSRLDEVPSSGPLRKYMMEKEFSSRLSVMSGVCDDNASQQTLAVPSLVLNSSSMAFRFPLQLTISDKSNLVVPPWKIAQKSISTSVQTHNKSDIVVPPWQIAQKSISTSVQTHNKSDIVVPPWQIARKSISTSVQTHNKSDIVEPAWKIAGKSITTSVHTHNKSNIVEQPWKIARKSISTSVQKHTRISLEELEQTRERRISVGATGRRKTELRDARLSDPTQKRKRRFSDTDETELRKELYNDSGTNIDPHSYRRASASTSRLMSRTLTEEDETAEDSTCKFSEDLADYNSIALLPPTKYNFLPSEFALALVSTHAELTDEKLKELSDSLSGMRKQEQKSKCDRFMSPTIPYPERKFSPKAEKANKQTLDVKEGGKPQTRSKSASDIQHPYKLLGELKPVVINEKSKGGSSRPTSSCISSSITSTIKTNTLPVSKIDSTASFKTAMSSLKTMSDKGVPLAYTSPIL